MTVLGILLCIFAAAGLFWLGFAWRDLTIPDEREECPACGELIRDASRNQAMIAEYQRRIRNIGRAGGFME